MKSMHHLSAKMRERMCPRCLVDHPAINGMTPWDYFHDCANLGKYEEKCTYNCACAWLDQQLQDAVLVVQDPLE